MYKSREGTPVLGVGVLPSHHPLSPIFTLFRQLINRMIDLSADTGRGTGFWVLLWCHDIHLNGMKNQTLPTSVCMQMIIEQNLHLTE